MSIRAATVRRIEDAHRFSAFYRGSFANHLPMALVALDAMGADDARLERFTQRYAQMLEPVGPGIEPIRAPAEDRFLGSSRHFPDWVDYFDARLRAEGQEPVLREWLEKLAPGIGSAAFHGAIRTAYAIEAGSRRELVHALAYWACAYERLEAGSPPQGDRAPAELLAAIAGDPSRERWRLEGRSIAARMRAASRLPEFPGWVASADPSRVSLDSLAHALIEAYCASGDFTLLHGVTGLHAAGLIAPHCGDARRLAVHLWNAVLAAYIGCGAPPARGWSLEGDDGLDWAAIHRRAVLCDDEHDVKLAYSCWREWQRSGDDLYRRAASARVAHAQPSARPASETTR